MNPYQTPQASLELEPKTSGRQMFWAEGDLLVCRSGAILPPICIITNEHLDAGLDRRSRVKMTLTYVPPWVYLGLLLGPLGAAVAYFALAKACRLEFSLNRALRRKRFRWAAVSHLAILGSIASVVGAALIYPSSEPLVMPLFYLAAFLLAAAVVTSRFSMLIRVVRHRDGVFYIKGVCPEFLQTIREPERAVSML